MTRTYNKKATALPYAPTAVKRARTRDDDDIMEEDDGMEVEDDEESDLEVDMLIKV